MVCLRRVGRVRERDGAAPDPPRGGVGVRLDPGLQGEEEEEEEALLISATAKTRRGTLLLLLLVICIMH